MKLLSIILVLFFFIVSSAFAATPIAESGIVTVPAGQVDSGAVIAAMSRGVLGNIISNSYSYALVLKHILGSREYASASGGTNIYYNAVAPSDKSTPHLGLTLTSSSSVDFADWNPL